MAPPEGNLGARIGQPAWQNLYGILVWVGWPLIGLATAGPAEPIQEDTVVVYVSILVVSELII